MDALNLELSLAGTGGPTNSLDLAFANVGRNESPASTTNMISEAVSAKMTR